MSVQLAGITGEIHNHVDKRTLFVFCADNGVVAEGVASAPQSVTLAQTINLTRAKTGASVLARRFGCKTVICDVGVNADVNCPEVLDYKLAYGTQNIAKGPAMTRELAERATEIGRKLVYESDTEVIGIGEMGIGNTTTSSAILSVLTNSPVKSVTGRGGGISDEGYIKKIATIERAIELNNPDPNDAVDVLSKMGGFDLAAMAGGFIGAAEKRIPAVIDGFISVVAALCAVRIVDSTADTARGCLSC